MERRTSRTVARSCAVACVGSIIMLVTASAVTAADSAPLALDPAKAAAATPIPKNLLLAQANTAEPAPNEPAPKPEEKTPLEAPPVPITFGLRYSLYSDYFWRGMNYSEYAGEGREKPNHQLTVSLAFDLGDFGRIRYETWVEWYAAQIKLNPDGGGGQNCQEVDYSIWYSYSVKPIDTDVTVGLAFYKYLNQARVLRQYEDPAIHNDDESQEISLKFEHNDAWTWKSLFPDNEEAILNPSFFVAQDIGSIVGTWMEWGISHDFTIPGIENLTITPGYSIAAQCGFWQPGMFLAGDNWSLTATYDLTPVLKLPVWAGTVSISGELYYWNAYDHLGDSGLSRDTLWGGLSIDWCWGG